MGGWELALRTFRVAVLTWQLPNQIHDVPNYHSQDAQWTDYPSSKFSRPSDGVYNPATHL